MDTELVNITIKKHLLTLNHVICLGIFIYFINYTRLDMAKIQQIAVFLDMDKL